MSAADPLQTILLSERSDHFTYDSSLLTSEEVQTLEAVFQQNKDVFAWTHYDMPGIHISIASHRLNVIPSSWPIFQNVRCYHLDKQRIIQAEVEKLLTVGFIREVEYPEWLEM